MLTLYLICFSYVSAQNESNQTELSRSDEINGNSIDYGILSTDENSVSEDEDGILREERSKSSSNGKRPSQVDLVNITGPSVQILSEEKTDEKPEKSKKPQIGNRPQTASMSESAESSSESAESSSEDGEEETVVRNAVFDNNSCFACSGRSLEECKANGRYEVCDDGGHRINNGVIGSVCSLEVRYVGGILKGIETGCKQAEACSNNENQNFNGPNLMLMSCRPEMSLQMGRWRRTPSVCRTCMMKCDESASPEKYCFSPDFGIPIGSGSSSSDFISLDSMTRSQWSSGGIFSIQVDNYP